MYNFDYSAEGFTKPTDYTYSDVHWDSANKRIYVLADRRDSGDEMLIHTLNTLDTSADFVFTGRFAATVQGNWQGVFPVFLTGASNSQVTDSNSIYFFYASRDSNLLWNPHYFMYYRDASGVLRISTFYEGKVNTEYHFYANYDSSIQMLTMEIRSATDSTLKLAHYRIGTNANDGFTLGKIGAASDGASNTQAQTTTAWVDDIILTYAAGSFRDATQDKGDQTTKIGWLADNFNDNTNEVWTVEQGSPSWTSGAMQLGTSPAIVRAGTSWYDQRAAFTFKFLTSANCFYFMFRYKDSNNYYYVIICQSAVNPALSYFDLWRCINGCSGISGQIQVSMTTNTVYTMKIGAKGNYFELWWQGLLKWSGPDNSPPSTVAGLVKFQGSQVTIDDVWVWNTDNGFETKNVRDAGAVNKPLQTQIAGSVDNFNQIHAQVRSSADNVTWGPWTNLKADMKTGFYYALPDQDRRRYYQLRAILTSGTNSTPSLTSFTTQEGVPSTNPTSNTGFEAWYPSVDGLVNAVTGNVWYLTGDLSVRAKGFPLSIIRSYNSLRGSEAGPFGNGWTFNYNEYLTVNGDNSVSWNDGDGSKHTFQPKVAANSYDAPRGVSSRLVKNGDSTFTLWHEDGTRSLFSSVGKLSSLVDKNGNAVTLTYTGSLLTSVADGSGKAIYFGYDGASHIVRGWDQAVGTNQRNATSNTGSWTNGADAYTSNNAYAKAHSANALHTYSGYGFTGTPDVGIWKVEACVEAYSAGDDDLGVKISTDGGSTWNSEQVVNLPASDPNALTCLDFTSARDAWSWTSLSNANLRVQVRYVKVGGQASWNNLDWIPVKVSTASRLVQYTYSAGSLIQAIDTTGLRVELYTYSSDKLVEVTDHTGTGKWTNFVYDGTNRAIEIWRGLYQSGAVQWKYKEYSIAYTTTTTRTITNARGYTTTITLNSFGNPTQVTGPSTGCGSCASAGNTTSYAWDGEMNRIQVADGRGFISASGFDFRSNLRVRQDPGGNISVFTWSEANSATQYVDLLSGQTSARGYSILYAYDSKGNSIKTTDALGDSQQFVYDASGFLNKSSDFRGNFTWYEYTANGYLSKLTDPLNEAWQYGYDAWGRTTSSKTPMGFTTTYTYDKVGRRTNITDPVGGFTTFTYNIRGDLIAVKDPNGNTTSYQVNVTNGENQVVTDAMGNATNYAYDLRGNLLSVTDANTHTTRYEYDAYDRTTKVTSALGYIQGFFTSYAYDIAGNRIRRTDANGASTLYGYDRSERLYSMKYPDGSVPTFGYDPDGNLASQVGFGYTQTTAYDEMGRPASVTFSYGSFSKTTSYKYDKNGNQVAMVDSESGTTSYTYDAVNRLTKVTVPENRFTQYGYDKDSRRTTVTYENGVMSTNEYDNAGRLKKLITKKSDGITIIESYEYTYDKNGNRLSEKLADASTTTYSYDKLSRLKRMVEPGSFTTDYSYDAVGNLLIENTAPTYTYDEDDHLLKIDWGGSIYIDYTYDNNGNRKSEGNPSRGFSYFTYDYENRLVSGYGATHNYDATGTRVKTTVSTTTTYYGYDMADRQAEFDSTGTRQARYTHGGGTDEPVEQLRSGSYYTYQRDGLGSVTRITDGGQSTINTYTYTPWGDTSASGPLSNPFQYTGREADSASQLYHYRARVYDPAARRFLTKDPAGMAGGGNRYAYVGNNPVNLVDPTGTDPVPSSGSPPPTLTWQQKCLLSGGCDTGLISAGGGGGGASSGAGGISSTPQGPVWTDTCTFMTVMTLVAIAFAWIGFGLVDAGLARAVWNAHTSWAIGAGMGTMVSRNPAALVPTILSIVTFILMSLPWWHAIGAGATVAAKMNPVGILVMIALTLVQIGFLIWGLSSQRCI